MDGFLCGILIVLALGLLVNVIKTLVVCRFITRILKRIRRLFKHL